jgi:RHS repeat-associated protein
MADGAATWTYEWDGENRLTRVLKNSVEVARFAYDPLGRRVEKVAGGVTRSYAYDGEDILRETAGSAAVKYVHGPGIDEPLASEDGGGVLRHVHADGLWSVVKVTGSTGSVTLTRQYDAWGKLEAGSSTSGFAFTGREWDPETGLYYYRARYYGPKIGRFFSEDPIGYAAGPNWYTCVLNNPLIWIDPMGLVRCTYTVTTHTLACESDDGTSEFQTNQARSGFQGCRNNPSVKTYGIKDPFRKVTGTWGAWVTHQLLIGSTGFNSPRSLKPIPSAATGFRFIKEDPMIRAVALCWILPSTNSSWISIGAITEVRSPSNE